MTGLEALKEKWTIKITEYNNQIQKMGGESISSSISAIGFSIPTEEDDYDED